MIPRCFACRAQNSDFLADSFDYATVLFCTFGHSSAAEADPVTTFALLNRVYMALDSLLVYHRAIKVEHVGNDYMVVSPIFTNSIVETDGPAAESGSGAPEGGDDDPDRSCASLAELGLRMIRVGREALAGSGIELRAGLAAGPVAAAVIGESRRFLRVLGDTVNTAARLCALAEAWEVQCSAEVAEALGRKGVATRPMGVRAVKGKGELPVHVLVELSLPASVSDPAGACGDDSDDGPGGGKSAAAWSDESDDGSHAGPGLRRRRASTSSDAGSRQSVGAAVQLDWAALRAALPVPEGLGKRRGSGSSGGGESEAAGMETCRGEVGGATGGEPRSFSSSWSTMTIGVFDCICLR